MSVTEQVIEFVATMSSRRAAEITEASSFYDLGIDGDDATDLLDSFAERFEVDMKGFLAKSYYGRETAWNPFSSGRRPDKVLTIAMLVKAAEDHKWPEVH